VYKSAPCVASSKTASRSRDTFRRAREKVTYLSVNLAACLLNWSRLPEQNFCVATLRDIFPAPLAGQTAPGEFLCMGKQSIRMGRAERSAWHPLFGGMSNLMRLARFGSLIEAATSNCGPNVYDGRRRRQIDCAKLRCSRRRVRLRFGQRDGALTRRDRGCPVRPA
jgi:hypothetical protein